MNKKIIAVLLALIVCADAAAQPKSAKGCPRPIHTKDFSKMDVVDTTRLRVRYAFCAERIGDPRTYIDLQRLDVGRRVTKYYSQFVYLCDSLVTQWMKANPRAQTIPGWLGEGGRKPEQWSEYEWTDYFFEDGQLTEYCTMPQWLGKYNSRFTEAAPRQQWTLCDETKTILGYTCQRATCRFRGRDFVAWFAPDIPVRRGPWKFQGLPGLILQVYDVQRLYTFEAIGLETRPYPITRFRQYRDYRRSTREKVWRMQRRFNENWFKAVDFHRATVDAAGNMVMGEPLSIHSPYEPLELE